MLNILKPIHATRPLLKRCYVHNDYDAIKVYPDNRDPSKVSKWTVTGPRAPNEVWIHRASKWSNETGYSVGHRHSGFSFPRLFAPLPFEQLESDPRHGHKSTHADTFTEAYALAVQLVRAYQGR